jgi:hypothetical protein
MDEQRIAFPLGPALIFPMKPVSRFQQYRRDGMLILSISVIL